MDAPSTPQKNPSLCGKAQRLGYTLGNQIVLMEIPFVAHPFRFSGKGGDFVKRLVRFKRRPPANAQKGPSLCGKTQRLGYTYLPTFA
jgi:hypothetical protein